LEYRREIDGLRAVAVVPVILFHAGITGFAGGYVGVDVFFVISGFLITTLLIGDLGARRFSIGDFYARRARRILPALVTVIVACLPFAWLWLPPNRFESFSQSIATVGLFVSNFHFAAQEGYFAAAAEEQPLLHTWSLAVEEQYYLLFPVLLALGWRFARRWVVHGVAAVALASFAAAALATRTPASGTFFLPHLRAWELLIGSLTAFFLYDRKRVDGSAATALGASGLVLIGVATVWFDASTPFPSSWTLLPTVGAALVIIGASGTNLPGRILSARPLVGVGLVSYSAYLWHFPLFAFARILSRDEPPVLAFLGLTGLTFELAWFTWRYIENPCRDRRLLPRPRALALGGAVSVVLVVLGVAGQWGDGFPQRLDDREATIYAQLTSAAVEKRFDDGACRFSDEGITDDFVARFDACAGQHGPAVFVVGDSHGTDLFNALARNASVPFVVGVTRGFCRLAGSTPDCHYDDVHAFVEGRPGQVSALLYTQKGSYLLTDHQRLPVKDDQVAAVHAWLTSFQNPQDVVWVGPQMEPHVDVRNLNPLTQTVVPGDAERELSVLAELDDHLWAVNTAAGVAYVSKIDLADYAFETDFLTDDGYTYSDTDHWSALGEQVFGARLLRDPTLARLLRSDA
jgi:peptidoglycan/LPS O-acetylase OafA/YrhL